MSDAVASPPAEKTANQETALQVAPEQGLTVVHETSDSMEETAPAEEVKATKPEPPPIPSHLEPLAERVRTMLKAGLHFGHRTSLWNPGMKPFIFGQRNGIHILDLVQTVDRLDQAKQAIRQTVVAGEKVVFVCTKRQGQAKVKEIAEKSDMAYVDHRWLGGFFTNFKNMHERMKYLRESREKLTNGEYDTIPKKEKARKVKEIHRLENLFGGVAMLDQPPQLLVIIDPKKEYNAVQEARKARIPIVATLDSNCDPKDADYGIPANDDAIRAIHFILNELGDAAYEARQEFLAQQANAPASIQVKGEGRQPYKRVPYRPNKQTPSEDAQREIEEVSEIMEKNKAQKEKDASIAQEVRKQDKQKTMTERVQSTKKVETPAPTNSNADAISEELLSGIGANIVEKLKETFSSMKELKKASHDDLVAISGIGEAKAKAILEKVQSSKQ